LVVVGWVVSFASWTAAGFMRCRKAREGGAGTRRKRARASKRRCGGESFLTAREPVVAIKKQNNNKTVLEGMDVVKKIEALGSGSGKTSKKITIADSGELPVDA